jgi:hypothetical protein
MLIDLSGCASPLTEGATFYRIHLISAKRVFIFKGAKRKVIVVGNTWRQKK